MGTRGLSDNGWFTLGDEAFKNEVPPQMLMVGGGSTRKMKKIRKQNAKLKEAYEAQVDMIKTLEKTIKKVAKRGRPKKAPKELQSSPAPEPKQEVVATAAPMVFTVPTPIPYAK